MKREAVVFGSGGHSKVICELLEELDFSVRGLIDDYKPPNEIVNGYKILGNTASICELEDIVEGGVIAIGDNWRRSLLVDKVKKYIPNFNFLTLVHPKAVISKSAHLGVGTVVMAGVVINSEVKVGQHCIINTNSSVDHECILEDFSTIAPGATLGGKVVVGKFSAISLGSNVIHGITIGSHTVVGAGSTVIRDIGSNVVAFGSPATVKRIREVDEAYL